MLVAQTTPEAPRVWFGVVGGTALTRDFPISRMSYQSPVDPYGRAAFDWFSDTRSFLGGVSFEVGLSKGFSLEANALRRNLHLAMRDVFTDGSTRYYGENTIGTWEWPILAKYRFPLKGNARPFVEAGPSFRTRHNPVPAEPSQFGATVGTGIEFRLSRFRISPALRYTRWQYDGDFPRAATKRDQIELVTGFSYGAFPTRWGLANRRLHLGAIGGLPLTGGLGRPLPPERLNEQQGYIAGLVVEYDLARRVSIELDGLYRPFRARSYGAIFDETGALRPGNFALEFTVLTWEFPVLVKYRMRPDSRFQPIFEAGPSFRAAGNANGYDPSRYGFTAGAGIETRYKAIKLGPVLRYTRWAPDHIRLAPTLLNQVELLCSFTF